MPYDRQVRFNLERKKNYMFGQLYGHVTVYWGFIFFGIMLRDSKDDIREGIMEITRMLRHPGQTTVSELFGGLFDKALMTSIFAMQIVIGAMLWPLFMGICIHEGFKSDKSKRLRRGTRLTAE